MLRIRDSRITTLIAIVAFYLVMLGLNGEAMLRKAELLPYGRYRQGMVALARPFAGVARLGPGVLRKYFEQMREQYWKGVQQ